MSDDDLNKFVTRNGRRIAIGTVPSKAEPKKRHAHHHIGCPVEWLKRVIPVVRSKEQLAVALWLQRRHAVCRSELFEVPNKTLHEELGLSREVKYKTLWRLEKAGAIAVVHDNKRSLQVRILW